MTLAEIYARIAELHVLFKTFGIKGSIAVHECYEYRGLRNTPHRVSRSYKLMWEIDGAQWSSEHSTFEEAEQATLELLNEQTGSA